MIFRHRHRYEAIAVSNRSGAPFSGTARITEVLLRCPCRNVATKVLTGEWTLAQIRGEPVPVERLLEADLPTRRERTA